MPEHHHSLPDEPLDAGKLKEENRRLNVALESANSRIAHLSSWQNWIRVLESSSLCIGFSADEEGVVYATTPQWVNYFAPEKSLPGNGFFARIHPDDVVVFWTCWKTAFQEKKPFSMPELRVFGHEGHVLWFQIQGILVEDEGHTLLFCAMQDITTNKNREIALEEMCNRFLVASDAAGLGVWEFRPNENTLLWDDVMYRVFNVDPDEFEGVFEAWASRVHPEDLEQATAELNAAIRNEKNFDTHFRIVLKNGDVRYIKADARVIFDQQGNSQKIIGINYDITKQKSAELALARSLDLVTEQNKRLLNFSYIVSHNLRSHTSNIKSITAYLLDCESESEIREMLHHLNKVSNRLDETLHNLNEVVSIQTNMNLHTEPLKLDDFVRKALDVLEDAIRKKQVQIKYRVDPHIKVQFNPAYLESVLLNFISNAIKYSHPEREAIVELETAEEGGRVVLFVIDNGLGIDLEKYQDKLFGMYKTFHNHPEARGIGLFIAKSQIDAMGGTISVESVPNEGTCFKIGFK